MKYNYSKLLHNHILARDLWRTREFLWKKPKKCFQGGKGPLPPHLAWLFSTHQKRRWGFDPPQIFGAAMETYCQRTAKCRKMSQNATKHRKTQQKAAKGRKTPQNAATRRKTPQNATIYCKLAISLRGPKYLGGLKNPAPFSGLLKLIVDHNWGATAPFPLWKHFFWSMYDTDGQFCHCFVLCAKYFGTLNTPNT